MLTRIRSAAVVGVEASPIEVEVDVASGLPGFSIVGLPDTGVKEGRTRIRGALDNIGSKLPPRKVTVNLAPADIRKDGAAYDLPIAIGILTGSGLLPEDCAEQALFVGELALDGRVRPVRGVLPMAAWARRRGLRRMYVPHDNAAEAAVAGGDTAVLPVTSLNELIATLRGEALLRPVSVPANDADVQTAGRSPLPIAPQADDPDPERGVRQIGRHVHRRQRDDGVHRHRHLQPQGGHLRQPGLQSPPSAGKIRNGLPLEVLKARKWR
jgi:magnesium chelatase family protein